MKVLIFSTAYLPFVGGAELAIKEITDRLGSPFPLFRGGILGGASFDLITLNLDGKQKPEERIGNVNVIRLSCSKLFFPILARERATKLHSRRSYTHVWSIMASYGGFAGLFFKRRFRGVPFILTLQEGDSLSHIYRRAFLAWPLFRQIFTRADRITAISNYLADWARKMGAKGDIRIISNGVNIKNFEFRISNIEKEEIRKKLGIQKEDKVVITTSRLVEKNGVGHLIESLRYLPENVKLLILGTGSLEPDLKLKAKSYQLEARVKFVGFVPHNELPPFLHAADVFVRPSRSEGMGSSFIEAMAAGLPVVATPVGGIPDFLAAPLPGSEEETHLFSNSHELENRWGGNMTGVFVKVGDPRDIAEKIKCLLSNDELRNRIIANASNMVREKYGWGGVAERMKEVFDKI